MPKIGLFEERLNKIIDKYGLPFIDSSRLEQTSDWNIAVLEEKCSGRRVALWGAGDGRTNSSTAKKLLSRYATYLQETVCIIDSNPALQGTEFLGLPVISPEEVKNWNIECIVVATSARWRNEVANRCLEYVSQDNVVIPKTDLTMECYRESNFYLYINLLRIKSEEKNEQSRENMEKLISCYLKIRDFSYAFRYMEQYVQNGYDSGGRIERLHQEINSLLQEMQDKIRKRKDDILLFFADRLNRKECECIQMFSYMKDSALVFTDANATGLYTYESMASIVNGVMPLERPVYRNSMAYHVEEAPMLREALKQGKHFDVDSIPGYPIFQGKNVEVRFSAFVTIKLWNALCSLCESQESIFEYIYVFESHYPELCGYHPGKSYDDIMDILKDNTKCYRTNYLDCLRYIDEVFRFYESLFPKNMKLIIHSDHSFLPTDDEEKVGNRDKLLLSQEYCTEIPLLIRGAGVTGEYRKPFSMIDFPEIVNQVVAGKDLQIPEREIVRYQMLPIHNRNWRARMIESGMEKYIDEIDVFASDKYICLIPGKYRAQVYHKKDIQKEITDTPEGKAFLEKIGYRTEGWQ